MKARQNRPGRKDQLLITLAAACAAIALAAAPARAATGGLAPTHHGSTAAAAQAEPGIAFAPMRWAAATWYGPGLYGNRTACGQTLRPTTMGVAHRTLPCGTQVKLAYAGRQIVTRVIDRGPYSGRHDWDLTNGVRRVLGFEGSDRILYAVALRYARR